MARHAWALLALVPCILPGAAASVQADLEVRGEATFAGDASGTWGWEGSLRDSRLGHPAQPEPLHAEGRCTLVESRFAMLRTSPGSPAGDMHPRRHLSTEHVDLGPCGGSLAFGTAGPAASLRLVPAATEPRPLEGSFAVAFPQDLHATLSRQGDDALPPGEGAWLYPRPGGLIRLQAPVPGGPFEGRVAATDYLLDVAGRTVDTRWRLEGPAVGGVGEAGVLTTRVLLVDGSFHAQGLPADGWVHSAAWLSGALDGDLLLANAQGQGSMNGTPLPPGMHLFQAIGPLEVRAAFDGAAGNWTVAGQPTYLGVNAQPVAGSRALPVAVGVGVVAAALGALVAWARGLAPFIPGLNVAEPLGNRQRTALLALVATHPGAHEAELRSMAGVGRATVRHHLRILVRADLVTPRRSGNRLSYTLNDSSYDFAATAAPASPSAGQAVALLRHPVRDAVAACLRDGDLDSEAMRARLAERGLPLPAATLAYHLGLMADAKLLGRRRSGRRTVWTALVQPAGLRATQRDRFLVLGGLAEVLKAVGPGCSARDAHERLRRERWRGSLKDACAKLDLLAATGYLAKDGDAYRPVPA